MGIEVFDFKDAIVLTEKDLMYEKIKSFFEDTDTVVKVSSENSIDYEFIKSSIPKTVADRPNIYGIYTQKNNGNWVLKYIGQRKHDGILERLRQHLINKHKKTGSKLKQVKEALINNSEVGIKLFSIRPDAMRLYYEERLISDLCQHNWNEQKHK